MDPEEFASLMNVTKTKIGDLISKPKMSEKLLGKPPFRFLHDTITAVISTTGFGEGLYDATELDSAQITEKQAKLNYLDKIFNLVGICKGSPLQVKAAKVISGLEPENTNLFLIAFAECASDPSLDSAEAVRRCLSGEEPGSKAPPKKSSAPIAESKSDPPADKPAKGQSSESKRSRSPDAKGSSMDAMEAKMPDLEPAVAPERGKSRGGTRGGKPNQATADIGLSGFAGVSAPNLDGEIERCDGSAAVTQTLLGELISRPKLTEKLLGKPPFRFLHDIVNEVIKATGFASTLYTPEELDSSNVSDKTQKIDFLEKIIKVVGVQLNTLVEAKPAKIVAGLDAQITNNFLQLLAVAAKHMPDSTNAVRTVLDQNGGASAAAPVATAPEPSMRESKQVEKQERAERPEKVERQASQEITSSREPEPSFSKPQERREISNEDKAGDDLDMDSDSKRSARPSTARRRPPKVKDGAKEVQAKDLAPAKKTEGIIIDGAGDDEEDDIIPEETRLVDELHADAKGSDMAGDPQSKIVKDIMSRQAEQEMAGKVAKSEPTDESKNADKENKGITGGSGIRLGRLRKTGNDKKGNTASTTALGETELEKMRSSIQLLVQQTGPLGSCMDYIQEDITMMTSELHRWEEECRKYEADYDEAKRKTKEILQPLKKELMELEDQILDQIAKISTAKAENVRNDEKIQQVLKLVSSS